MARRHGWQLPAHSFQVVAITVFFLLSVAFFAFFAPFLGKDFYEYLATGIYSFLALCVFILYARCTAIDPADPGILIDANSTSAYGSHNGTELTGNCSMTEELGKVGHKNEEKSYAKDKGCCSILGGCLCGCLVKEDCRKDEGFQHEENDDEDALFCTLCNAEVRKFSKHCRSCDKCVDGFDHHCRWLNNCVGRKNYFTFVCLMAASLVWLVVECAVGITVLVRCFVDRKATENQIINRLGDGFSRPPFATVVAICTALSFLAIVPLGELFFFHIILIQKGLTTYEYVVAMRTQNELPEPSQDGGDQQSLPSSPTSSSVTAISGRSSVGKGLQYRGAWCTPPRIFMDHQVMLSKHETQPLPTEKLVYFAPLVMVVSAFCNVCSSSDEIIHHLEPGRLPSTVDPDAPLSDKGKRGLHRPIRISAWKLAKLDSNEALKAGAKARTSSSILRPVNSKHHQYDADNLSSATVSGKSSPTSTRRGYYEASSKAGMSRLSSSKGSYPPSRASRDDIDTCGPSVSNLSSPLASSVTPSPLVECASNLDHFNPMYQSSTQSPLSARTIQENVARASLRKSNANLAENSKSSVYWDPEVGRFVSAATHNVGSSSQGPTTELTCTGQSIFFGGPLVNEPMNRETRTGSSTSTTAPQRGTMSSYYQQGRSQRGGQLPVFVPSDSQQNKNSS